MRIVLVTNPLSPKTFLAGNTPLSRLATGQGFIGVNEMLAFKLPISLYEKYMKEAHHDAPLREEEKLTDTADFLEHQARASKSKLDYG
jgi:hypothetical protein